MALNNDRGYSETMARPEGNYVIKNDPQTQKDLAEYNKPENVTKRFNKSGNMDPQGDRELIKDLDSYQRTLK